MQDLFSSFSTFNQKKNLAHEHNLVHSVYSLGLQVKIVLSCSYNFDKLASACHILFPSCGTQNEILWAQTFDQKAAMGFGILNGISIGLLNLSLGFNSVGFYQVWLFVFVLSFSRVDWIILVLTLNVSMIFICIQMTKLAIIPCTVLLETLFLGKKFRYHLASHLYHDCHSCLSIYALNILT